MVLQLLASAIYTLVEHSWIVATWLSPLLLATSCSLTYQKSGLSFEALEETILDYSRLTVLGMVLLGMVASITGFMAKPPFLLFWQLSALLYFGFLFWRF